MTTTEFFNEALEESIYEMRKIIIFLRRNDTNEKSRNELADDLENFIYI